jgi:predicted PurR-regulated permease PerM
VAKASIVPAWQRALIVLTATVVGVVVVSCLYWAQKVFIPVALAVFLTFLLAPLVSALQRRGVGRTFSVVVVVALAMAPLGGVLWLVAAEVTSLARELPTYTDNIKGKIRSFRQMGPGSITGRLEKMIQDITGEWKSAATDAEENASQLVAGASTVTLLGSSLGQGPFLTSGALFAGRPERPRDPSAEGTALAPAKLPSMVLQPESPAWLAQLPAVLSPVVDTFGVLALALVLVIFMLLKREDLRNRLIRLVGDGRLTATTKAVDDAGQRISRFLLMQAVINVGYGLALAVGLFAIRVPHAWLWGLLAALLRYVPYLGTMITSVVVVTLSLAAFPGWVQPLLVLGLLGALELLTYNVIEPRLFSHSTGVSEVAVLVAAAFWAFLWGPIGLVLSNPLTVCLVVLGKYVAQLEFLNVLLGDEPALDADVSYYQRLLARDQDEATQLVLTQARTFPPESLYDALLLPALNYVKRDREREDLTEADEQYVLRATREIVEDLGERQAAAAEAASAPADGSAAAVRSRVHILGCPGHDEADQLGLVMLQQLLDPARWDVEILSIDMLSAESVARAGEKGPAVVCIGALPPGGLAHTRYLCKRLRARLPDAKIVVGRWGLKGNVEQNHEQLLEAGADQVETNLLETRDHLNSWLPVLAHAEPEPAIGSAAAPERRVAV